MPKTFASFAFGCRVNQAEKEEIDRQLSAIGYQYSETNPDFFIINSCAVTQKAQREVRQFIYQTRRKFPKTKIIVTGCAATKWMKEKIKIPQVDLMIDNQNKENIPFIIANSKRVTWVEGLPTARTPTIGGGALTARKPAAGPAWKKSKINSSIPAGFLSKFRTGATDFALIASSPTFEENRSQ